MEGIRPVTKERGLLTFLPKFGEAQVASHYADGEEKKMIEALQTSV